MDIDMSIGDSVGSTGASVGSTGGSVGSTFGTVGDAVGDSVLTAGHNSVEGAANVV